MPQGQHILRRSFLLLLCGLSALPSGCSFFQSLFPEPIPYYRPNAYLVETMGVYEAQQRLQEILLHAIEPPIVQAEVTEDGFLYRTKQVIAGFATGRLLENRVPFANAVYVRIYPNNVVLVQTSTKVVLARLVFGNEPDTRLFVDLVTSFHTRYVQRSAQ